MTMSPVVVLTTIATISSAAIGGLFYAFSTFVMRGLDRTGPVDAITAMRGIDAEAQANPPFLSVFVGSALLAVVVGIVAVIQIRQPGSGWLVAGAVFAVIGVITTIAFNVPLNDHLDTLDPAGLSAADAAREWQAYYSTWTAWNHVRTIAPLIGAALFAVGLRYR
ncbi:DUF1772 domain-containing protein [Mycobacterium sp.]|jgi:uncharacterized membrane protein|uniref:anthrone oxygenase family protein n=1 Tax=Mycobacterium sp. TaxID=1785 RepID=UPI002D68B002|nr:anthrone oxygenase family protein [Mycobacterium sp.]HZA11493.1 anthrone oxygenase family protein [Mycobacterium sp.]